MDKAGNTVVAGLFSGTATFGEGADAVTLTSAGDVDIFIAKWLVEAEPVEVGPEDRIEAPIAAIKARVATGDLRAKTAARPLIKKLGKALASLARGKLNAACGQLGAFANQDQALARSRRLAVEDAAALLAEADEVRDQLGC